MFEAMFKAEYIFKGYVVFEHDNSLWWLRFLQPGFRHCYVLLQISKEPVQWLEINPSSNQLYIFLHSNAMNFNYIYHLQHKKNITIIPVEFSQAPLKCAPFAPFTCVEFAKRILGIHKFFLMTPYQLYKYLCSTQK